MKIPPEHEKEFDGFPTVLRDLVAAELEAGNGIGEFAHGFPAAPCGAYIMLTRPVTTCPRATSPQLHFYDRNGSAYSGEFTDAKRHFFVLEPPHPPQPPPDMDAIRAEWDARCQAADAAMTRPAEPHLQISGDDRKLKPGTLLARFKASMEIDYEKWHDGTGYDLSLIELATPQERQAIEDLLIPRRLSDWRDVEALAALGTEASRKALLDSLRSANTTVRMAVHSYAPDLITGQQRTDSLVRALQDAEAWGGLPQTLLEVERFHPPEVIRALLRGLMERDGGTAVHFAAMLFFLHGKAPHAFDWEQRPFFLRFNTADVTERAAAYCELCEKIGVSPQRHPLD